MTYFTYVLVWLCVALFLPVMLFLCALELREQELIAITHMDGAGKRLLIYTA